MNSVFRTLAFANTLSFLFLSFVLVAQSPEEIHSKYSNKYPDKMAVFLEKSEKVLIDFEEDTVKTVHIEYKDLLYLTEQASLLSSQKAYESYFSKVEEIEAYTLVPNGRRYKKVKVDYFSREKESSAGIFYDDLESVNFTMPSISPKARTQVSIEHQIKDPRFLSSFYLDSYAPVEKASLELKVHKNIAINYRLFNIEESDIDFTKKEKGDYVTYTWTAKEVADFKSESNAPRRNYLSPHIVYYVTQINYLDRTQKVATEVADLYDWYSNLACKVNLEDDENLQATVDELTKGISDEQEKVKQIYYWVQDNIKYVAFEDGMRGFVPSEASFVYEKRYGDCKGMSSIIHKMLNMAGVENTYLTWIGSRSLPYKYSEVPTPIVDNHMIVTYEPVKGKYIYLDATDSYSPFGFPSSMIQGKEALLGVGRKEHQIATVPIIRSAENTSFDSVRIKIADEKLFGEGFYAAQGYPKGYAAHYIDGLSKEGEENYMRRLFTKGNNKFSIEDYEIKNLNEKDKPLQISYDFKLEDYAKFIGDEIYINPNLEKPFENADIDTEKRIAPIENDYLYTNTYVTEIEIPEGYEVEYVPEGTAYENDLFGFELSYQQEGNIIKTSNSFYKNYLLLQKDAFKDWNEMVEAINKAYREVVIIKKKG